jgi:hypothetical protein
MYSVTLIELAECRRQDYLAEAARNRLASQVQPTEPRGSSSKDVVRSAMRAVCASARGAVAALAVHPLRWSSDLPS